MKILDKEVSNDFLLFIFAVSCVAFAQSLIDSTFNNFLNERFMITSLQRTLIEIPREMPGVIVIFVSALFFFFCNRRLAAVSQLIAAAGVLMMGLFSAKYSMTMMFVFVLSIGQHLFLPLNSDIGMELAHEGKTGKRLGQLQGAGNVAAIIGSLLVFVGFKYLHIGFSATFVLSALFFLFGSVLMFMMHRNKPVPAASRFKFRKEYKLYYILSVLYGTRKQIFLTFAPWVLVTVFMQKTQMIATLLAIGGVTGIWFKPFLGKAIDRYGEKTILAGEAITLIFVCIGYGFARKVLPFGAALIVASVCYIADQLLMSVSMARATYLKKIAVEPGDVTSKLTAAVSIDHVFSVSIALLGGVIWNTVGYEYIFLVGGLIALTNLFFCMKIKPDAFLTQKPEIAKIQ